MVVVIPGIGMVMSLLVIVMLIIFSMLYHGEGAAEEYVAGVIMPMDTMSMLVTVVTTMLL